jgi:hypothetical protein
VFNVAPRLSYCMETVGTEPVVFYRTAPAGQIPSYPESETPTPVPGYKYVKVKITATGGYDSFNVPFFNVDEYGASDRRGERFLYCSAGWSRPADKGPARDNWKPLKPRPCELSHGSARRS